MGTSAMPYLDDQAVRFTFILRGCGASHVSGLPPDVSRWMLSILKVCGAGGGRKMWCRLVAAVR